RLDVAPATHRQHNRERLRYETGQIGVEFDCADDAGGREDGASAPLAAARDHERDLLRHAWRLLSSDFPPRSTVFRWFRRFRDKCLFDKINHRLLMLDREYCGRQASPTASIID